MKVYAHIDAHGEYSNPNIFIAIDGFRQMGWEVVRFREVGQLSMQADEVLVGPISAIQAGLRALHITPPAPLDYPPSLAPFLGRKVWNTTMHQFAATLPPHAVFVKPARRSKSFTGRLVQTERDLIGCYDPKEDEPVWCAEPVQFLCEWRCYVRYGSILDVRPYRGNWRLHFDAAVIEQAVGAYVNAPHGYALDFGVTADGRTLLVEANDGYALGAYGLDTLRYAKLLSARWNQLTGSTDLCNF